MRYVLRMRPFYLIPPQFWCVPLGYLRVQSLGRGRQPSVPRLIVGASNFKGGWSHEHKHQCCVAIPVVELFRFAYEATAGRCALSGRRARFRRNFCMGYEIVALGDLGRCPIFIKYSFSHVFYCVYQPQVLVHPPEWCPILRLPYSPINRSKMKQPPPMDLRVLLHGGCLKHVRIYAGELGRPLQR